MNTLLIYNISAIIFVYFSSFFLLLMANFFIFISEKCSNKKTNIEVNAVIKIFTFMINYLLDACRSFKNKFYYSGLLRITFEVSYDLFIIIFLEIQNSHLSSAHNLLLISSSLAYLLLFLYSFLIAGILIYLCSISDFTMKNSKDL